MTDTEIARRLEKLERDNRRFKRLAFASLVLVAALGTIAATRPVPQKITAREFDVVDGTGKVRIRLSTTSFKASVEVLDAQGNSAASMEVYPGFSSIGAGKDGGDVALLTSSPQLGSSIGVGYSPDWYAAVGGKSGKALRDAMKSYLAQLKKGPNVGMAISPSGQPSLKMASQDGYSSLGPLALNFYDSGGTPAVSLMNAQGLGGLTFYGKKKQRIGNQEFPVQRMSLADWGLDFSTEDGTEVIRLGGAPAGGGLYPVPHITLSDAHGFSMDLGSTAEVNSKTGATQQTSADSIIMFGNDKDHHAIWQAP